MLIGELAPCVNWPMVIGVGPLATSLLDYLPQRLTLPQDAVLYSSDEAGPSQPLTFLEQRLTTSDCVLVIVDGSNALAREQARYWSQWLLAAKVYFHTTLILNTPVNPEDRAWLQDLHPVYIEVLQDKGLPDQLSVTFALLPLLPFLQNGLCMYDASDLRLVLQTGTHARTTAIRWRCTEHVTSRLNDAIHRLGQDGCKTAMLGFNCSVGYTLAEYDTVNNLASQMVGENVLIATFLIHSPDLEEGERELSITLLYG